jgi:putative transposase
MDRTVIVHLHPTTEQASILQTTLEQHTACFNEVAAYGFAHHEKNGIELHKDTYYQLRAQFPSLGAQLVCAARVKATEAVASALTRLKHGRTVHHAPHSVMCPIRYDARSYWVKWEHMHCSVLTVAGRLQIPFSVPKHAQNYIGHRTCSADLCSRRGHFMLHVVVDVPSPDISQTPDVIGVDLGETRPAVLSTRVFLGERRWKEQERRLFRLQRRLQARGTKSAKRHLKKLSGKRLRQRRDHDHVISKRIVQHTPKGATLVFENLKDIRHTAKRRKKNTAASRRFHSWSFAQLLAVKRDYLCGIQGG